MSMAVLPDLQKPGICSISGRPKLCAHRSVSGSRLANREVVTGDWTCSARFRHTPVRGKADTRHFLVVSTVCLRPTRRDTNHPFGSRNSSRQSPTARGNINDTRGSVSGSCHFSLRPAQQECAGAPAPTHPARPPGPIPPAAASRTRPQSGPKRGHPARTADSTSQDHISVASHG